MQQSLEASVFLGGGWRAGPGSAAASGIASPRSPSSARHGAARNDDLTQGATLSAESVSDVLASRTAPHGSTGGPGGAGSFLCGDGWEGEQVSARPNPLMQRMHWHSNSMRARWLLFNYGFFDPMRVCCGNAYGRCGPSALAIC